MSSSAPGPTDAPHASEMASGVPLSDLLVGLVGEHDPDRIAVSDLVRRLDDRAFGVLALLLALPNVLPGPAIPGFSALFGLPLALLTLQMAVGWHIPRLPGFVSRRTMDRDKLRRFLARAAPVLSRFERLLRPRYAMVLNQRLLGVALTFLAVVMSLPLPFGNLPAAFSIIIVAMGIAAGDGLAVLVGLIAGAVSAAWNGLLLFAGVAVFEWLAGLFV